MDRRRFARLVLSASALAALPARAQVRRKSARVGVIVAQTVRETRHVLNSFQRLPSTFPALEYVEAGGLMWSGVSFEEMYRHSAGYVDRILRGAKPADLPVEAPKRRNRFSCSPPG